MTTSKILGTMPTSVSMTEIDEKPLTESEIRRTLSGKMSRDKIDRYIEIQKQKTKRNVIVNPLHKE